jgi:hypothetical protein
VERVLAEMTFSSVSAALEVYLSHTLASTLQLTAKLNAEDDGSREMKRCVAACSTMLKYARNAQTVCGPLGLVALDRSEEHLRVCMRNLCAPSYGVEEKTVYSVAAFCYAYAVNRQCWGDSALQELCIYAGLRTDAVAQIQANMPYHFCEVRSSLDHEFRSLGTMPLGEWTTLLAKASQLDISTRALSQSGQLWSYKRADRTAHLYRYAALCAQIAEIHDKR